MVWEDEDYHEFDVNILGYKFDGCVEEIIKGYRELLHDNNEEVIEDIILCLDGIK